MYLLDLVEQSVGEPMYFGARRGPPIEFLATFWSFPVEVL